MILLRFARWMSVTRLTMIPVTWEISSDKVFHFMTAYMWRTRGPGKRARKLNFDIFVNLSEIRCFLFLNPLFVFILLQMVKETWLFNQSFHFELSSSWLRRIEQKRWGGRDKYFRRSPCLKRVGKTPCLNAVVGIWGRISKNSHFVNCASCDMTSYRDRTGDKWNDRRLRKLLFLHNEEFKDLFFFAKFN